MRRHSFARRTLRGFGGRSVLLLISLLLLVGCTVGGTVAWLTVRTQEVQNTFVPAHVTCEVEEESFDPATGLKTDVKVKNTGDTDAYIRVRLITYRRNSAGKAIGGMAEVPAFSPGAGWVHREPYYYYTQPVASLASTGVLIDECTLATYEDADGGTQVLEVLAEAVQSTPAAAVGQAWGVSIAAGNVTGYAG